MDGYSWPEDEPPATSAAFSFLMVAVSRAMILSATGSLVPKYRSLILWSLNCSS